MYKYYSRFTLTEVKRLTYEGFKMVTPEAWRKKIEHVREKVEDHYWEKDGLYEEHTFEFIIQLSESDFEDSSNDDSSSSDSDSDSKIDLEQLQS